MDGRFEDENESQPQSIPDLPCRDNADDRDTSDNESLYSDYDDDRDCSLVVHQVLCPIDFGKQPKAELTLDDILHYPSDDNDEATPNAYRERPNS